MEPVEVVDWSVNWVTLPKQAVSAVKLATGRAFTVTAITTVSFQPFTLVTISCTSYVPALVKLCVGFCAVELLLIPDGG